MAWGAIAMAGLNFVQGMVGGASARDAARAQNKAQQEMIDAQYKRDKQIYKINFLKEKSEYAWNMANTEAARYQERVKKADFEAQQERIIDSALLNLQLNTEALRDQFVASEKLRAIQEGMELDKGMADERLAANRAIVQARFDGAENALRSMENVGAYVNSIRQAGLQADQLLASKENEGQNIQEQIVIGEQLDTLKRDAQAVSALLDGADRRAGAVVRGGGSNNSRRIALDSMKAFGRSYSELTTEQARRRSQLNNYNAEIAGESSVQMAQLANGIQDATRKIAFTREDSTLNLGRITNTARLAQQAYDINANYRLNTYNDLTIPTFELAAREGNRQYKSLVQNTINDLKAASTPYREAIIFDPLKPIKGLKPEKGMFTPAQGPSWGSIIAGSVIKGAQGAMSMSYTDQAGNLKFR